MQRAPKERQAETLATEARGLLAEAAQAREQAARLTTEADALIAQAEAAEALAADYRALASNPPSVRVVTQYLYDQEGRLLGEYDGEGHVQREYVYLEGMPLALMAPTGIYYYHADHLGTPQSLTDSDQTVVWQAHYDPFGRAGVITQAVVNSLRLPGQYFDAETGLHYNYFRDYDPSIGRYIQSDPIGLASGINTYVYVHNNPVRYADLYGLDAFISFNKTRLKGLGTSGLGSTMPAPLAVDQKSKLWASYSVTSRAKCLKILLGTTIRSSQLRLNKTGNCISASSVKLWVW